jgi:tRNA pseudouridine38-40 synthase
MQGGGPGTRNLKAVIEYDGTEYAGFQRQTDLPTIQGELERALSEVTQEKSRVVGAGRTDAGVHAQGQVINFLTGWKRSVEELHRAFNALLSPHIAVKELSVVPSDFHARFSAVTREYRYTILNQELRSPLRGLGYLVGAHDFASFGSPTQGESTVRDVLRASCVREGPDIYVDMEANAFLRHMVRSIVGTLLLVGRGIMSPADVKGVLEAMDRSQAGPPVPGHGLCLVRVNY